MATVNMTWAETLRLRTVPGALYRPMAEDWVRCYACGHECKIPPGKPGICQVRYNDAGTLKVPAEYVSALMCDPIEKKPFFHAMPGTDAMSFGMLGCDLHCPYCQNWVTSQALRDPKALAPARAVSSDEIVKLALDYKAATIASTYNEPLITAEWAVEIFQKAKAHGLKTAFVSNGNATPQVLEYLRPWLDFYKVDLKSFRDKNYRQLGGRLDRILDTIRRLVEMGFWVEIVTLIVPGFNDSEEELAEMARFLAGVSVDMPWHVTAFHRDYKMTDPEDTPATTLLRAYDIGREAGLRYVYAGNLTGRVGPRENTSCPTCGQTVIERYGFHVLRNGLQGGKCPGCGTAIAGVWM